MPHLPDWPTALPWLLSQLSLAESIHYKAPLQSYMTSRTNCLQLHESSTKQMMSVHVDYSKNGASWLPSKQQEVIAFGSGTWKVQNPGKCDIR